MPCDRLVKPLGNSDYTVQCGTVTGGMFGSFWWLCAEHLAYWKGRRENPMPMGDGQDVPASELERMTR